MLSLVSCAVGVEIHVARRLLRRALAEVDERRAAVREADQHEPTAADVAGKRVGDGEREADRNRGVHRVAAFLQHGYADVGGDRLHRDDHAVLRTQRLANGADRQGQHGENEAQQDRQASSHTAHCRPDSRMASLAD